MTSLTTLTATSNLRQLLWSTLMVLEKSRVDGVAISILDGFVRLNKVQLEYNERPKLRIKISAALKGMSESKLYPIYGKRGYVETGTSDKVYGIKGCATKVVPKVCAGCENRGKCVVLK